MLYNSNNISYCVSDIGCSTNCKYCFGGAVSDCFECEVGYSFVNSMTDRRCVTNVGCGLNCDECLIQNDNA